MHHPFRADLPKWCFAIFADFARGYGGFVKLAITPFDPVDLHGGKLQLLFKDHPRAAQKAGLQARIK